MMLKIFSVLFALQTIFTPVPSWEPAAEDVEAIARTLYGECRGVESEDKYEVIGNVHDNQELMEV